MTDILRLAESFRSTTPRGGRNDPYMNCSFLIEIEGLVIGGFSEVSGLQVEIDVTAYREGGENLFEHQLAGPARYPQRLVLKHGLTDADGLWDWQQQVANGLIIRRNATIYLLDQGRNPVLLWDVRQAYPVRWSGPELRAEAAQVAFETVELVHHGITRGVSPITTDGRRGENNRRLL